MPSIKSPNHPGGNSHFNQKLRNFFRINPHNGVSDKEKVSESSLKSDSKTGLRQPKRFFTTVGRLRSTTTASEGNPLDDVMSPTASANPYFAHQGQPGLRHYDTGSVPPSPPDTPSFRIDAPGGAKEHATNATKEELARKLRRVASAPNAQGLFNQSKADGERPATAELGKEPLVQSGNASSLGLVDSKPNSLADARTLSVPERDGLGALPPPVNSLAFRRTYSSNSIKVRTVEVGPASFDKIKLIGKGDVGKVYLVREKKSTRLYAMKGQLS
jgi:protein-serine/threonine kinase